MKKLLSVTLCLLLLCSLAACNKSGEAVLKVALLVPADTDAADTWIDIIWAGISGAKNTYNPEGDKREEGKEYHDLTVQRVVCPENTTEAYVEEIKKLCDQGYRLIYLPGPGFAAALEEVQGQYPQCRFGAIDFTPRTAGENIITILCDSAQAGFAAGFVTALRLEEGRVGCIVGENETGAKQLSWGFQQGIKYANENYDTNMTMLAEDFLVAGTFSDPSYGQQLTAQLFDKGVKCVFLAARATGAGGFIEGRDRRANGTDVWVVGSDGDQFTAGLYDGNNSVTLTSAMRRYADPIFRQIEGLLLEGELPHTSYTLSLANSGVGIAGSSNNLTVEIRRTYDKVVEMIKEGDIVVSQEKGNLY